MTKIDIFSGFLGAGKTTLIKKLLKEAYSGEKLVLIENEFGEIGVDGGFLQDAGIEITEMNSGCICCSLVGDFSRALEKVLNEYKPDRIVIEPSGVGKLSDVIKAVKSVDTRDFELNSYTVVVDAVKCKMYMKNFGEFFGDQIENASAIILSHTDKATEAKINESISLIREHNESAVIISTPIDKLSGADIVSAIEGKNSTLEEELDLLKEHEHHGKKCGCGHHHHEHGEECGCGHHHHEHGEECGCGHHHHEHGEECGCGHHHHEHDEECGCGHHHGHHHADEVFASFGAETANKFTEEKIAQILKAFDESDEYGFILRAKGIVDSEDGEWIHFDYVPDEPDIRRGSAAVIGRLCVIGSNINEEKIKELIGI